MTARGAQQSAQRHAFIGVIDALPNPGTSSLAYLEKNMPAENLQLSAEEWKKIEDLARKG